MLLPLDIFNASEKSFCGGGNYRRKNEEDNLASLVLCITGEQSVKDYVY